MNQNDAFSLLGNVFKNVKLVMDNSDLFYGVKEEDLYHSPVVRYTPYEKLEHNIKLCRMFKLDNACKIKLSMLKYDMEHKINTAIELGLLKSPLSNEFKDFDYLPFYQEFNYPSGKRLMHDLEIRNYFSNYIAKLMSLDEHAYAYYSKKIFDVGFEQFYKEFFENEKYIGQHVDKDKELYNTPTLAFVRGEDAIENYKEYSDVIDENKDITFDDMYYDQNILSNLFIQDLEVNNIVYDEITVDGISNVLPNEFVYKFNKKLISRYKVLRYASILHKHYSNLDKNMIFACILKDSYIVDSAYNNIISSMHNRRRI